MAQVVSELDGKSICRRQMAPADAAASSDALRAPQRNAILSHPRAHLVHGGGERAGAAGLKYIIDHLSGTPRLDPLMRGLAALASARTVTRGGARAIGLADLANEARPAVRAVGVDGRQASSRCRYACSSSQGVGAIMTRLDRSIQGFVAAVTQILFNILPAAPVSDQHLDGDSWFDWNLGWRCWC